MAKEFTGIVDFIQTHTSFVVTSHSRPDGDSLGSSIALGLALKQIGKKISIVQADRVPNDFLWLPGVDLIEREKQVSGGVEGAIILECNNIPRTGLKSLKADHIINIDHHTNTDFYGDLNWVDDSAAAVAEMVFKLIECLGAEITSEIATNLYVAIITDTGCFRFSNTTEKTFTVASRLVSMGADPAVIARSLYSERPESSVRLLAAVLSTLEMSKKQQGSVAWIQLTEEMLSETGATREQTEGLIDHVLAIQGVKAAVFYRQEGPRTTRVSLRSSNDLDVAQIARHWGGGGHRNAAGLTIDRAMPDAIRELTEVLQKALAE